MKCKPNATTCAWFHVDYTGGYEELYERTMAKVPATLRRGSEPPAYCMRINRLTREDAFSGAGEILSVRLYKIVVIGPGRLETPGGGDETKCNQLPVHHLLAKAHSEASQRKEGSLLGPGLGGKEPRGRSRRDLHGMPHWNSHLRGRWSMSIVPSCRDDGGDWCRRRELVSLCHLRPAGQEFSSDSQSCLPVWDLR